MEKLLWLGTPYFFDALSACGWQSKALDFNGERIFSWRELIGESGFEPDILVVAAKSIPPFVPGIEEFPCLTVLYAADSHIHGWLPHYAQGFDACLVSLEDCIENFAGPFLSADRIWWSPPYANATDEPDPDIRKDWDCLFVGSNNRELTPKRAQFLSELGQQVTGLQIREGNYRKLFPHAKVLINQAEKGNINFRVFEAMGCGACLVTPRVGHGLEKLFVDGEHLVGYAPHDAGDAAYRINFLLQHPDLREHIAQTGYEEINARHRSIHRAQAFTEHIFDLAMGGVDDLIRQRLANAAGIRQESLKSPYLLWSNEASDTQTRAAYLAAARGNWSLNGMKTD